MKVLIIGSGGREHALAWKLSKSPKVKELFIAPGNGGTASLGKNLPIKANNISDLLRAALELQIDLTVVGPEGPLSDGIVDLFQKKGLRVFGPTRKAAMLESSKAFAKEIMEKFGIPCARGKTFDSFRDASDYVKKSSKWPMAVKADGLAAGKGVIIAGSEGEALAALTNIMVDRAFGAAGDKVVIEEGLMGKEVSLIAFTDGKHIAPMPPACDYKRIYNGDKGPNTGGMGSYSPPPFFNDNLVKLSMEKVLEPVVRGMAERGDTYKGVLYAGLMLTNEGPKVLEFNARFGDPETQVILPRLKTDLIDIMLAVIDGSLNKMKIEWSDSACVGIVLASEGYPGEYATGFSISGLDKIDDDVFAFHAGSKQSNGDIVTDGGRILTISATGKDLALAREKAYTNAARINFQGCYYRKDIALFAYV